MLDLYFRLRAICTDSLRLGLIYCLLGLFLDLLTLLTGVLNTLPEMCMALGVERSSRELNS